MLTEIAGMATGCLIVTLIVATIIILVTMENRSRRIRQKMLHDERMLALEKGLPVPMDYTETRRKRRPYLRGMVMCAIGLGMMVLSLTSEANDKDLVGIGSIFVFVGIALLIGDRLAANHGKEQTEYPSGRSQNLP